MNIDTISMLCNPYTQEPFELKIIKTEGGEEDKFLESIKSGQRFPFHNEIPVLYDASLLQGYNLRYNSFYRKVARFYDPAMKMLALFSGGGEKNFRRQYIEKLEIEKDSKVLEVSIGTGVNIPLLPDYGNYYGLDLSWEMLTQCQRKMRRWKHQLELFYGNAELLPFRTEIFDVVFHVGGINAFSDRAKAIAEMVRVAKSGTRIVIADETSKMMEALSWMPSVRKMIVEWGDRFNAPVELLPKNVKDIQVRTIVKDLFYELSFRKR